MFNLWRVVLLWVVVVVGCLRSDVTPQRLDRGCEFGPRTRRKPLALAEGGRGLGHCHGRVAVRVPPPQVLLLIFLGAFDV